MPLSSLRPDMHLYADMPYLCMVCRLARCMVCYTRYGRSDGPQPHFINIQFRKKTCVGVRIDDQRTGILAYSFIDALALKHETGVRHVRGDLKY